MSLCNLSIRLGFVRLRDILESLNVILQSIEERGVRRSNNRRGVITCKSKKEEARWVKQKI